MTEITHGCDKSFKGPIFSFCHSTSLQEAIAAEPRDTAFGVEENSEGRGVLFLPAFAGSFTFCASPDLAEVPVRNKVRLAGVRGVE